MHGGVAGALIQVSLCPPSGGEEVIDRGQWAERGRHDDSDKRRHLVRDITSWHGMENADRYRARHRLVQWKLAARQLPRRGHTLVAAP
ncbi:hypothetical protein PSAC2689_50429 [Paraburkholderia sacchari]